MRLWESVGWRAQSTHLAVERRAPKNTVVALYFRMGFRQIRTLEPISSVSVPFLTENVSSAINSQYLDKNTSWIILGRFGVVVFVTWFAKRLTRF